MHLGLTIADIAIVAGIIVCGIIAYSVWSDRPATTEENDFSVVYNQTDPTARWDIRITYTTKDVFAARTPLNVTAIANTWNPDPVYANAWIYFPLSSDVPPKYEDGAKLPAHIELKFVGKDRVNGRFQYVGSTTLLYATGGEKFLEFWEVPQEFIFIDGQNERKALDISGEDSKYQYETNKATLALTWAVVGLTLVVFRGFIRDFVDDFHWKDPNKPPKWKIDKDW